MPSVFISYRHQSDAHRERVRSLALRLRLAEITVTLDALKQEEEWHMGGPPEGWPTWSYAQIESNMCLSLEEDVSLARPEGRSCGGYDE